MFGALMYRYPAIEYFIRHKCGGAVLEQTRCCDVDVFDRALLKDWTNQFVHIYVWAQPLAPR